MSDAARLPDWTSLNPGDRAAAAQLCRGRLAGLGVRLNAVAAALPDHPRRADGPLGGLPYAAKDLFATGRHSASNGLAAGGAVAPRAEVLQSLDAAGAVLVTAAEMTALAYEPSGYNAARGRVLNPWDFTAISGGSSSGSAALVAAGCVFAALGTDTGGSVRIPAHCCGVTALKPGLGRIPTVGAMALAPSLDTVGLMARSARDLAALWPVVSDGTGAASAWGRVGATRAALLQTFFAEAVPQIRAACQAGVAALAALDVSVTAVHGFPDEADEQALLLMQAEAARTHRQLSDHVDPVLRKRIAKGLDISDDALAASLARRTVLREDFLDRLLGAADVALAPTLPITTPDAQETDANAPTFRARTLYALSRFTRFINYLDLPVLSLPVGSDERGRPVGLQIIGRPRSEALLLAIGTALQATTTWHGRVPTAVADDLAAEGRPAS